MNDCKKRLCRFCADYKNLREDDSGSSKYCATIDDRYSEHYMGRFFPPSGFGCSEFRKRAKFTCAFDENIDDLFVNNPNGYVVMAYGYGIHESIGCSFKKVEDALEFMFSFENDLESLDEFMQDSDYKDVTKLYID